MFVLNRQLYDDRNARRKSAPNGKWGSYLRKWRSSGRTRPPPPNLLLQVVVLLFRLWSSAKISNFFQQRVLGENGSNNHAKLKSENGFQRNRIESWFTRLVLDFMCAHRNILNCALKSKRIQGVGPKFRGTSFPVGHVPTLARFQRWRSV